MKSQIIVELEYKCTKMVPLGPSMNPNGSVPCWGVDTITKIEGDSDNPFLQEWIQKMHGISWGCQPLAEGTYKYPFGEFVVSIKKPENPTRGSSPISMSYAVGEVGRKRVRIEGFIRDKKYRPKRSYSVWGLCGHGMAKFTKESLTWTQACVVRENYRKQSCYKQLEIRRS